MNDNDGRALVALRRGKRERKHDNKVGMIVENPSTDRAGFNRPAVGHLPHRP